MKKPRDGPSKAKILLVDDQPANLLSLKAGLEGLEITLVEAHSGEEALRLMLRDEFAVVLLDVEMPHLDGFETATLIRGRAESRHTPIIFQTAYDADRRTIEKAYALGAVDFLVKPLMPVVLRAKVQSFVELYQHKEQNRRQAEQLRLAERQGFQQKLAEENARLEEERERLRVTLASIGDGVIATDREGCVTFLNPVAEALTGWTTEAAAGQPLQTVFHIVNETTRKTLENPVAKVLATGQIVGLANHTVLIAKDGTERAIDDSAAPIRDGDGNMAGVVLVFRDVTERRQAERTARLLASVVESSDDAIIGKDINGVITSWNRAAERLFGYTAAESIGKSIAILAPPDRADEMPGILARLKQGRRVEHFDTERRARDGRLVPISLTVSPIEDEDGQIIGASKIARDISERKRAEEALREEKERLHATLTGIGDAVIVTDANGRVTLMNPVAQTLTGWKDGATGRPLEEVFRIINEETRQLVETPVNQVIREGTIIGLANHTTLIALDGVERPIEDSAAPVRGRSGEVVGVVLVFRDSTEQRRAEEAVRESRRREKERADELEAILRATPTPIWIAHDPDCRRITGNPASYKLLALPEEANVSAATLPGHDPHTRGFREYQGDQPIPVDELPMQRATRGESVHGVEVKFVFNDGGVRHIYGNAVPLRNPDGSVRGCVAAFADVTPLKQAEESLRRNQEIFKLVHQIGKIGHWEWNSLTDENKWSPEIEALYGLQPGTFEGTYDAWAKLLHPDDLAKQEEVVRRAFESGLYFTEFRVIWPDGSVHWLEARGNVLKDDHGKPVRFTGVNMDITERKHAEELLASELDSISRLHALGSRLLAANDHGAALADVLENAIKMTGADFGNIQVYNPQTEALEITAHQGFQQDFLDYFRTVQMHDGSACAAAMQSRTRTFIEDVELDLDFSRHRQIAAAAGFRAVQSTPLISRNGTVIGMLSTHYGKPHRPSERDEKWLDLCARTAADFIERSRFEASMREQAEMLESAHDAIIVRTIEGVITYWNSGAEQMYGWTKGEALGEVTHALLQTEFTKPLRDIEGDLNQHEQWEGTLNHGKKDGGRIVVASRWALRRAHQGKSSIVLEINRDITHQKRAEEALKDADRHKDEFLAMLAHELRGPLAPLRNMLEIMKRAHGSGDVLEQARSMMERQLGQLVRLVDDLLDVSRISRNMIELRKERVELASIIHQSIEACRPLADSAGHEVSVALPPQPIYLHADPVRLAQVFGNILNNACKYTKPGGKIWLAAERQGSDAVVTVKDTGLGIPPDKLDSVFDMFTQIDRTLERSQGGLGIGLTLVKQLVEMHDGSVTAQSDGVGKGSEFVVCLPILIEQRKDEVSRPVAEPAAPRRRFLVVDDNPDTASSLATLLRMTGNESQTAHDGLEAVEAAEKSRPDVVLLDIGLPKLNGYEVCRRIREQPWGKNMVIVALTGWGQDDDRRKSKDAGFDHHLVKPVDYRTLMKLLAESQAPSSATAVGEQATTSIQQQGKPAPEPDTEALYKIAHDLAGCLFGIRMALEVLHRLELGDKATRHLKSIHNDCETGIDLAVVIREHLAQQQQV